MTADLFFFGWLGMLGLGLIIGSFLTSVTYQIAKPNFSWAKLLRRSKCPKCGHEITWYDNIPLISYLALGGRCRACKKKISLRYPIIEGITAVVFVSLFLWENTPVEETSFSTGLAGVLGDFTLPYFLFLATGLLALAVVDLEHQIIPDKILFPLLTTNYILLTTFSPSPALFMHFFWASLAACFLLALVLVTRGRGMGLGDVKLSFLIGLVVGPSTWLALFGAFAIGAVVGLLLVFTRHARFGKPISFGPFLILGTLLVMLFGEKIVHVLAFV